jgi:putative aminopeptidase FrvX
MNIKETFIKLIEYNIPYNNETYLEKFLPKNIKKDIIGNYFIKIGNSKTMFTSHLDDASWGYTLNKVNHIIKNNMIFTDNNSILGADDKAGVTIMLYMIEKNIPGLYYFFIGEESGMIGSKGILKYQPNVFKKYKRCISFDRRDYGSVITHQMGKESCSFDFANALIDQYNKNGLPHKKDTGGIFTDSAAFIGTIPECTNLSVGYFNEHTYMEKQDIDYLEKMAVVSTKIKWDDLPIGKKNKHYKTNNYFL